MDKTLEKIRHGGLPAATDAKPVIETGDGNLCSGCGETIESLEELYAVRVVMSFRFHDVCYNGWATFKR
jgi:hypothetical protein